MISNWYYARNTLFSKLSEAVAEAGVGESLPPEEVSGRQERTTFTETTEAPPGGGPAQGLETGLVGLVLVTGLGEVEVGPGRETARETAMTAVSGAQGILTTLAVLDISKEIQQFFAKTRLKKNFFI